MLLKDKEEGGICNIVNIYRLGLQRCCVMTEMHNRFQKKKVRYEILQRTWNFV